MRGFKAFHAFFKDESRKGFRIILVQCQHNLDICDMRIGDEALTPIENVGAILLFVGRAAAFWIRATRWFCDSYGGKVLASCQTRQILLFLFIAAEQYDRIDAQTTYLHHHGSRDGYACDLFQGEHAHCITQAQSTIFFGNGDGHHFAGAQFLDHRIPRLAGCLHLGYMGSDLGFSKFSGSFLEQFLFFGECKIDHLVPPGPRIVFSVLLIQFFI